MADREFPAYPLAVLGHVRFQDDNDNCWRTLSPRVLAGQDCCNVLALAQQSDDVQVVVTLEVKPNHRETLNAPSAQTRDPEHIAPRRRADSGILLDSI